MAKNRYSKLFFGPLTRKLLVKPCRMRKSCCKGFRRSPDAWKTLLALRRSSWQSSGPSCVQTLLRPRRRISHGRDGFGQETNLERTRFAWRVFRAVMASGALPKPGKRCFRRGGATGKVLAQLCSNFATAETPGLVVFLAMRFGLVCARRAVSCCCGCRRRCQQAFLLP